jgi:hypothetical protein
MKPTSLVIILFAGLLCFDQGLHAQDADSVASKKPGRKSRSSFEAAVEYQSNSVYLGRKDSAVLPYFIPMLTYNHKSGFYASLSTAYLKNSASSRIDLWTLESGYSFSAGKYSGDLTLSKYFYNPQSTSVTAEITGGLSYRNSYNLGFIKPTVTATWSLGTRSDFEGSFGLEHSFELLNENLELTPTFVANASSLNYYDNYYKKRKFSRRTKQKTVTGTVDITGTVLNASAFRIMDYEASLPVTYSAHKWTFSFTPEFAIPVNAARTQIHYAYSTGTTADKLIVEKIGNSFYWTLGCTYRL